MWGELYDQADSMGRAQAQLALQLPCSHPAAALQLLCSCPASALQLPTCAAPARHLACTRPAPALHPALHPAPCPALCPAPAPHGCAQAVSLNSALEERGVLPTLQQPEGGATEGAAAGAAPAAPPTAPPTAPAAGEAGIGAPAATPEGGRGPKAGKSKKKKKKR